MSEALKRYNNTPRPTKAQILQAAATIAGGSYVNLEGNPTEEILNVVAKNSVRLTYAIVSEMASFANGQESTEEPQQ